MTVGSRIGCFFKSTVTRFRIAAGQTGLSVGGRIFVVGVSTDALAGVLARLHRHGAGQFLAARLERDGRITTMVGTAPIQQIAKGGGTTDNRNCLFPLVRPGGELDGLCRVDGQPIAAACIAYGHMFAGDG